MIPLVDNELLNVIQVSIGFFFIFCAFNSQGFIEETVISNASEGGNVSKYAGYTSMAIIYGVFTLSNFAAAPVVRLLGPRWGMVFGSSCYAAFQAGFLHLNETYLYISSAVLGLGAAVLWTGQGNYLALNSTEANSKRNSGVLWGISQCCIAFGGLFLYLMFQNSDSHISDSTVTTVYGVFTGLSIVGVITIALLRTPPRVASGENVEEDLSHGQLLIATFKLMFKPEMLFLSMVFIYTGIELSFWSGIYPTSISFTKKLGKNTNALLGLNAMAQGLGHFTGGLLFGILGDKTRRWGREPIILLATTVHIATFAGVYINIPSNAPLEKTNNTSLIEPSIALALVCGGLLCFADACWNTQIYGFLVDNFKGQSAQAFSIFKFYQSALACAAFFYGSRLQLEWHLVILTVTVVFGAISFFLAEYVMRRKRETLELATHENNATEHF
uniref:UNC93-like protein MFSD11 n=1 Tax=Steinernema glaseri TaxID=37863 RepID=A0A1I7YHP5_9BILA